MKALVALTPIFMVIAACSSSPTAPSAPAATGPLTGTWVGPITDASNGSGAMRVVLRDYAAGGGSLLTGSWSTTFADASKNGSGQATGAVDGTRTLLDLRPAVPLACGGTSGPLFGAYLASSLTVSGNVMTGGYTFAACAGNATGTLELRQE